VTVSGNPMVLRWWAAAYSNPTPAEKALEPEVAKLGVPYRIQHPIWALSYRLDFALPTLGIAIEVDDPSHTAKRKRAADTKRTARLKKAGWRVLRTTNAAVLADPAKALRDLLKAAGLDLPKPHPSQET
jgi:very-short-patch-repair endonuclease